MSHSTNMLSHNNGSLNNRTAMNIEKQGYASTRFLMIMILMASTTLMTLLSGGFLQVSAMDTEIKAHLSEQDAGQPERIALTGATIYTMDPERGGEPIQNGTILIENGIITAMGEDVEIPEDTLVEDLNGQQIYPGLIDAFSRMGIFEIGAVPMSHDIDEQGDVNPNVKPERVVNPDSRHIPVARSAGVLTSVVTPDGGIIAGQPGAVRMDGWTWEQMTLQSGLGLLVNWPSPRRNYSEDVRELQNVFEDARAYHTAKKAFEAGQADRIDLDSRWEAMLPLFEGDGELPLIVDAQEVRQIQDAVTWASNEEFPIVIMGGRDAHMITGFLKEMEVPVIITQVLTSPSRNWEAYDARYSLPAKLYNGGVMFAIAGDASPENSNRLPYEAGASIAFGLPADEALKSLTIYPAQILGLDDHVGMLKEGMEATLMITDGSPVEYATRVHQTYIRGAKSDMMDNHRKLYERYRKKVDEWQSRKD